MFTVAFTRQSWLSCWSGWKEWFPELVTLVMLLYSLVALLLTLIVNYFMKKAFIYPNESSRFLCQGSEIVTVQVFFTVVVFNSINNNWQRDLDGFFWNVSFESSKFAWFCALFRCLCCYFLSEGQPFNTISKLLSHKFSSKFHAYFSSWSSDFNN